MDKTARQKLGIKKWLANNGVGILVWSTGVGKTYGALIACQMLINKNPNLKILVSVPTILLKEQWKAQVLKTKFAGNVQIEVINSIIKKSWEVDLLIIDELHTSVSDRFVKIFDVVSYRYFLGLTATLNRLDGKESVLDKYAQVVDTITTEEAIKNKWLSPYRYYKVLIDVDDLNEYNTMTQKFNSAFAFFDYDFNTAMKVSTDWKFRNKYSTKMGYDNKQVMKIAMLWMNTLQKRKKFIMSHPKKFEIAKKIINSRLDKKIITFSATIKDAESFKVGLTLHSKKKKKENDLVIKKFSQLSSGVLNTSKAANAGLDVPDIDCEIRVSGTSSSIDSKQILGRGIRYIEGKVTEVFVLVVKGTVEEYWFNKSHVMIPHITINENQLDLVLNGESINVRKRNEVITDFRF